MGTEDSFLECCDDNNRFRYSEKQWKSIEIACPVPVNKFRMHLEAIGNNYQAFREIKRIYHSSTISQDVKMGCKQIEILTKASEVIKKIQEETNFGIVLDKKNKLRKLAKCADTLDQTIREIENTNTRMEKRKRGGKRRDVLLRSVMKDILNVWVIYLGQSPSFSRNKEQIASGPLIDFLTATTVPFITDKPRSPEQLSSMIRTIRGESDFQQMRADYLEYIENEDDLYFEDDD